MRIMSILRLCCPDCGHPTLKAGLFRTHKACRHCGRVFEKEAGYYAGAIYPFYGSSVALASFTYFIASSLCGLRFAWAGVIVAATVALTSPYLFQLSRAAFLHAEHRFFGGD